MAATEPTGSHLMNRLRLYSTGDKGVLPVDYEGTLLNYQLVDQGLLIYGIELEKYPNETMTMFYPKAGYAHFMFFVPKIDPAKEQEAKEKYHWHRHTNPKLPPWDTLSDNDKLSWYS